jgi:hypothetical protein
MISLPWLFCLIGFAAGVVCSIRYFADLDRINRESRRFGGQPPADR